MKRVAINTIEDFIEKAEGRIEVFALIHQSLSDRKNYGKINLSDYLVKLVNNILDVLGRKQVFVSFNAEGVFLDIQTATSLGLIINELVCNSIKHAFPEESGGRIVISVEKQEFDYQLFYGDNGVGCSSKSTRSLGLDLVLC
jgi:two-component sensor histidine kinase